jgi:hypothetical protein
MPTPGGSKPYPLNRPLTLKLASNVSHPGKWDGANWWVETQVGSPMLPIKDSFIKSWAEVKK